jgi:hypothetical protein
MAVVKDSRLCADAASGVVPAANLYDSAFGRFYVLGAEPTRDSELVMAQIGPRVRAPRERHAGRLEEEVASRMTRKLRAVV